MMFSKFHKKVFFLVLLVTTIGLPTMVSADDTEVFFKSESAINPNVLFIMDNSSSMEKKIDGKTRIQIMKEALSAVLTDADDDLNVGIMNYGSASDWRNDYSNGVKFPVKPINQLVKPIIEESLKDKNGQIMWDHHRMPAEIGNPSSWMNPGVANFDAMSVREYLPAIADMWEAKGNTPIVDALYEAALYYRGGEIRWQDTGGYGGRGPYKAAAHPSTYAYPEGVYKKSENFPGHEYPFTPEWYSYGQCTQWYNRRIDGSHFRSFKIVSRDWFSPWMKCPANSGYPDYTAINGSPATVGNCRIMRNDYVRAINTQLGGVFDSVLAKLTDMQNLSLTNIRKTDVEMQAVFNTLTDTQLATLTPYSIVTTPFNSAILPSQSTGTPFPRCRLIKEVRCGNGATDTWGRNSLYKCRQGNGESCRTWNYEECANPADQIIKTELVCDYDQCTSRYEAPKYISPIKGDCQSNYIVLMSDGKPEYSNGDKLSRKATSSTFYGNIPDMTGADCTDSPNGFKAGTCGPELTHYLATKDQLPGTGGASVGEQFVNTMVIGFSDDVTAEPGATEYLRSLVTVEDKPETAAKEGFFLATDKVGLVKAFTDALKQIVVVARSQASPGYSVNVRSGLEHEDDIYIPVFDKNNTSAWSGNLKKFKLVDINGHRHIRGKTPNVDAMTELGLFKDEAWDFWSENTVADGNAVEKGGVAEKLDKPGRRKLFSNLTGNTNVKLWKEKNRIRPGNDVITNEMVGDSAKVTSKAYRKKLIRFIRGWKHGVIADGPRKHMGDMLHSEPVIITYKKGDADGMGKEQYIFAATNEGYLHAFDSTTGEEKWAFMPKQLLKNIERQFNGEGDHVYGIDGGISYLKNGDDVYLFFGLRRGGRAYYAMNVSDIDHPKLMWKIDGANGGDFVRLGQSWSMPYIANVMHGGKKKTVLVFSGGHDINADYGKGYTYAENNVVNDVLADSTQYKGDDIYIVNAKTGKRLWSMRETMGRTDVKHEIPGGVRILDVNRNGLLDRMYFADIGGNVWRLDLNENLSGDQSKSKLVKLAKLGGSGSEARKFYNEPDVAQLSDNGRVIFTVSVGSGLRPHPINKKITDHMFILLDEQPLSRIIETGTGKFPDPIEMNDLASVKITATADQAGKVTKSLDHKNFKDKNDKDVTKITQTDKRGWYAEFPDDGEKVLAPSITFEGSIIFTTLVPKALTSGELINACESPGTQGRIYAMNILTGEASIDMDRDGATDDNDVFSVISASEIPGRPQRIFNGLKCEQGHCKHDVDIRIGKKNSEVGIENVANIESIYWADPEPK